MWGISTSNTRRVQHNQCTMPPHSTSCSRDNGNGLQLLFSYSLSVVVPHAHVGRRSPLSFHCCCLSSTSRQQTWPGLSCIPERPALHRPGSLKARPLPSSYLLTSCFFSLTRNLVLPLFVDYYYSKQKYLIPRGHYP